MFTNLSVKARILVLVLLPLVMMAGMAGLSILNLGKVDAGIGRIYDDRVVPLEQLKVIADDYAVSVIDAVNKANAGLYDAGTTLSQVRRARTSIKEKWQSYLGTTLTPEERALVEEAKGLFGEADQMLDRLERKLASMDGNVAGALGEFDGPLYAAIDPISGKITQLVDLQLRVAGEERQAADHLYSTVLVSTLVGSALAMILIAIIGFTTYSSITGPLRRMAEAVDAIARERNLSMSIPVASKDEIGLTTQAVNTMLGQFRQTLATIARDAEQVASAAEELSAVSMQTDRGLVEQQSKTEQVATAINEMAATVHEVASHTAGTAQAAHDADDEAEQGGRVLNETLDSIRALASEVNQTADAMAHLNKLSEEIGSVLDVIRSIAEQTNLLALNAAIEAARAGDSGRGFAVVADEVRTLAQRTQHSTGEIQSMIDRLQGGARQAAQAMSAGRERAVATVEMTHRAHAALDRITQAVQRIREMTTQIASAAEEQGAVAEDINRNIAAINMVTADNALGTRQTAEASGNLARLAVELQNEVSQFRL